MKPKICIALAILIQVVFYLSRFEVLPFYIPVKWWSIIILVFPMILVAPYFMERYIEHCRKWYYNVSYVLLIAIAIYMVLCFSGFRFNPLLTNVVTLTIFPLVYGAYIQSKESQKDDGWHYFLESEMDKSLIVDKPDGIEDIAAVIGRSEMSAEELKQDNERYSVEILKYAQGEFESIGKYILGETNTGRINLIIEQPTMTSDAGEELPLELENPHIYCDGSENAILVYNSHNTFGLERLNPKLYKRVNKLKSILVYEALLDFDKSKLQRTFYAPITKINAPSLPRTEYTREDMLEELPYSADSCDEELPLIENQIIQAFQELNGVVKSVDMEVCDESVRCCMTYQFLPDAIAASGFPNSLNIFYKLISIDREERVLIIDIPYREQFL